MKLGIIDIGSNSIKLLVAETQSPLAVNYQTTWETRISEGLGGDNPVLSDIAMEQGVEAVKSLIKEADRYQPITFYVVATSAVRDAENRDVFVDRIRQETGLELDILSGEQEAAYIGWGITTDPTVEKYKEFCLVDLGGGSMELIHIKDKEIVAKTSLPLGAVRLSEKCIPDPTLPMKANEMKRITRTVQDTIYRSDFKFPAGSNILAGTGGALTVAREIRAGWLSLTPKQVSNSLGLTYLRYLFLELASMHQYERSRLAHLPDARADIMPTALITLITVAELANASGFVHSRHNLRYGLAASLIDKHIDS
ncbi:hypothetical protein [Rubellicoccus peritrichatus]|uniref:Ppx/GppA phosphatase N-terminal domain-containing protein n=1 Tax=Rubellicoccus peritrichatus TaxID=3080537 RepID=A0AAQ3LFF8_9BACT|nr:hypothetical protein [Puniceicoccus sp. CR14]WOO42763.1 hypothetical protein RZN69_06640 [Puniceicoccus sp. CR14]